MHLKKMSQQWARITLNKIIHFVFTLWRPWCLIVFVCMSMKVCMCLRDQKYESPVHIYYSSNLNIYVFLERHLAKTAIVNLNTSTIIKSFWMMHIMMWSLDIDEKKVDITS